MFRYLLTRTSPLVHDFGEAQRERLAEISERCPVHKTLANGVVFSDSATFGWNPASEQ